MYFFDWRCVLAVLCFSAAVESYFTIVGPRTAQYKSIYKCILTSTYEVKDKAKVTVFLTGQSSGYEIEREIQLNGLETSEIEFNLKRFITVENFTLKAEFTSKNGSYKQSMDIFVIPKRYSVFVQTDKPVYKPGDEILYRILVLDSDLKPYHVDEDKLAHAIHDGSGNALLDAKPAAVGEEPVVNIPSPEISSSDFDDDETDEASPNNSGFPDLQAPKERRSNLIDKKNGQITTGLFSFSYQLSDEPIEGTWSINVTINNEYQFATIQQFEVKRYKLPRFQVFIDTKQHVNKDERDIWVNVYANYTFGKYVKGKAKIKAFVYDPQHPDKLQSQVTKDIDIAMKKTESFSIERELGIPNAIRPYQVNFDVEFEEALTGQIGTANTTVKVHKYKDFQVKIVREKKKFKPGFPYAFQVQVMQVDGHPAESSPESLKLSVGYHFKAKLCAPKSEAMMESLDYTEQKLLRNGKAKFLLDIPENTTAFTIKAQYFDSSAMANISRHDAGSREYMTIEHVKKMKGKFITPEKVDERFKIKIKLSEAAFSPVIHYLVVSRHGVVAHGSPDSEFIDKTATIGITATSEMSPTCNVIVYYIQQAGEIIYDQVKVDIPIPSFSQMSMQFQNENVTKLPGESCKLVTRAPVGSFVSLLGVDLSVKLLGHGNDIDIPRVSADTKLYDSTSYVQDEDDVNAKYSDFSESNAFIITNSFGYEKTCSLRDRQDGKVSIDDSAPDDFGPDDEPTPTGSEPRKVFPETWIFKDFEIGRNGKFLLHTVVPDTITSFVVSGFAVHPTHGLSIAEPRKITVFKEFFAKLFVPYSIRLDEVLKVDVSVFNYLSAGRSEIQATVTLEGQEEFEFVDVDMKTCNFTRSGVGIEGKSRTISVPYDNGAATYFLIRAKKVGLMKLLVRATTTTSRATDTLERSVKVEREGYRNTENKAISIDLRDPVKTTFSRNFFISFPENCIGDSFQVSTSAIGDLLGPALINIHKLIGKPTGCTEQIFKSFIPNIVAMKYLKAIGKLSGDYKTLGENYLKSGYEELLKRRKPDGSFNLWGEDGEKSVWLTAYVAKVLIHTNEFMFIDPKYISEALDFVKKYQNKTSGGFPEDSVHKYIYISKTATQRGLALTTFVAIAYLENPDYIKDHKETIDKAMNYISENVAKLKDSLTMSMAAYAFALYGHSNETTKIFEDLEKRSTRGDTTMFWDNGTLNVQVETAAYAVLALVKINKAHEVMPVVNWLISQRQASGGFHATTDTVIGVQALATYATAVYSPQKSLYIKLSYENQRKAEFNITESNALVLQSKGLKPDARRFELSANGTGYAHVQVTSSCSILVPDSQRKFEITAKTEPTGKDNLLHLKVCANFIKTGDQTQTGMTLMEAYLPSGYEYDDETEKNVKKIGVKRIETAHQKTVIVLYFETMTEKSVCADIKATRKSVVEDLKKYPVKIYDYYNQKLRASSFYSVDHNKKCGF